METGPRPEAAEVSAMNGGRHIAGRPPTPYVRGGREDGAYYGEREDGGPQMGGEGRMERLYRQGRPVSPATEMMLQEMSRDDVSARRLGRYMVVRKEMRPRGRDVGYEEAEGPQRERQDDVPRRTEILYIRSPVHEEDDPTRQYLPYDRTRMDHENFRSVSESGVNVDDGGPSGYRYGRGGYRRYPDYRSDPERSEGPNRPLKFSRYHRTDSDVYLLNGDHEVLVPPEGGRPMAYQASVNPWSSQPYVRGDYERDRYQRQVGPSWSERWEMDDHYHRPPYHRYQGGEGEEFMSRGFPEGTMTREERIRFARERTEALDEMSTANVEDQQKTEKDGQEEAGEEQEGKEDPGKTGGTQEDKQPTTTEPNEPDESKLMRSSTSADGGDQKQDPEADDSDSGIGRDGAGLRLKKNNLLEKKSLFTIAYDGMQTRGLKSAEDRADTP